MPWVFLQQRRDGVSSSGVEQNSSATELWDQRHRSVTARSAIEWLGQIAAIDGFEPKITCLLNSRVADRMQSRASDKGEFVEWVLSVIAEKFKELPLVGKLLFAVFVVAAWVFVLITLFG